MAVSRKAMTEGIRTPIFCVLSYDAVLQSLSQKSEIFASSLYTREPLGAPAPVHFGMVLGKIGSDLIRLFEPPSPLSGRLGERIATPVCGLVRNDMRYRSCSNFQPKNRGLPHTFAVVPVSNLRFPAAAATSCAQAPAPEASHVRHTGSTADPPGWPRTRDCPGC